MKTEDFDFHLPQELIAQSPIEPRDHSRLMVIDREDRSIHHHQFFEIDKWIDPGDLLVVNNTRVIPARLLGKKPSGAQIEVFLLKKDLQYPAQQLTEQWETLVKPGRKVRVGDRISFPNSSLEALCVAHQTNGGRIIRFTLQQPSSFSSVQQALHHEGLIPLPPYVHEPLKNTERYQTIFAQEEGAVAAPTAGLHFTPSLIDSLKEKGAHFAEITLHVGIGTFRPIKTTEIEAHEIHSEWFQLSGETASKIFKTRETGNKIVAVGTTSVRVLETIARIPPNQPDGGYAGTTDIYIFPPYDFRLVDCMITNFHLPRSSLLVLVSAFSGRELILKAYHEAMEQRYRFFSFGDACLLK